MGGIGVEPKCGDETRGWWEWYIIKENSELNIVKNIRLLRYIWNWHKNIYTENDSLVIFFFIDAGRIKVKVQFYCNKIHHIYKHFPLHTLIFCEFQITGNLDFDIPSFLTLRLSLFAGYVNIVYSRHNRNWKRPLPMMYMIFLWPKKLCEKNIYWRSIYWKPYVIL